MGWRVRRSVKLMPGLRLNIGKRGVSVSAGKRGATVNLSKRGVRTTVGIPGTGISYSTLAKASPPAAPSPVTTSSRPSRGSSGVGLGILLVLGGIVTAAVAFGSGNTSSSSTSSTSTPSEHAITAYDAGVDSAPDTIHADQAAAYEPSDAKACSRGCPCGNTCISCDKVCHVGASSRERHHHR